MNLKKEIELFNERDAVILAISTNKIEKGKELKTELELPFEILSDHRKKMTKLYKVFSRFLLDLFMLKNGLAVPSTIIIDKKGLIRHIYIGARWGDRRTPNQLLLEELQKIQETQ